MKTRIATLTMAFALLLTTTAFASEPVPASKALSKSVSTFIGDNLEYPEFAIENKMEGDVVLRIIIQEDGTFDVVQANCVYKDLKNQITSDIEKMETDKYVSHAGKQVNLKIKFDLQMVE